MPRIDADLSVEIYEIFKKYCVEQKRSKRAQLAWIVENVLRENGYLEKNNRVSIVEKNQAGRLGKAGGQPGSKD